MSIECGCGLGNNCFHTSKSRSSFHPNEDIEFIYGSRSKSKYDYPDFEMPKWYRIVYEDYIYHIERRFLFLLFWFKPDYINGMYNTYFTSLSDAKDFIVKNVIEVNNYKLKKKKDTKVYYEL